MKGLVNLFLFLIFLGVTLHAETTSYAQVSSFKTQKPTPGSPTIVSFEIHGDISNVGISNNDALVVKKDGFYFLSFSGQIGALGTNAEGYMDVWFVLNSKPVNNSNNRMYLSRYIPASLLTTTALNDLKAGDTISVAFGTSGPEIGLVGFAAEQGPPVTSANLIMFEINSKKNQDQNE